MAAMPALAVSAGILGALAGLTQGMGLPRWVMVVPGLAQSGDVQGFVLLHAYAGVAVGGHLGMLLTAAHVTVISLMQGREGAQDRRPGPWDCGADWAGGVRRSGYGTAIERECVWPDVDDRLYCADSLADRLGGLGGEGLIRRPTGAGSGPENSS